MYFDCSQYKQKGFAPILIILLIALVIGGYFLYTNLQKLAPAPVSVPQQVAQPSVTPNQYDKEQAFLKAYAAKYPKPSSQPIPKGLDDQLFVAFNKDPIALRSTGGKGYARYNFSMSGFEGGYYGDVAEGSVGSCTGPNGEGCGGGARWVMNKKADGNWVVIYLGQQDADFCENLKTFLNELKPWQGVCWDDNRKGLVDILHPNESYNNY